VRRSFPAAGLLVVSALATLPVPACRPSPTSSTPRPPPSGEATAAFAPASSAPSASAAPSTVSSVPCIVSVAPFVVAKRLRPEAGGTLARLPDGRIAVGFATEVATAAGAIIDPAGTATPVDVDRDVFDEEALEGAGMPDMPNFVNGKLLPGDLTIQRVTPLSIAGSKLRVAVDAIFGVGKKPPRMRCGPADVAGLAGGSRPRSDAGSPIRGVRDCRTFAQGGDLWVLGSGTLSHAADAKAQSAWFVTPSRGDAGPHDDVILSATSVPDADAERYAFDVPASVAVPGAGFVFAARHDGKLALARAGETFAPAGEADVIWLGAPIGMPALSTRDRMVALVVPLYGKSALFGATFPVDAPHPKPLRIPLDDDDTAAQRTSVTLGILPNDDIVMGFVEGTGAARRVRVVRLDATLKQAGPLLTVTDAAAHPSVVRLLVLEDGRVLLVYPSAGTLMASVVTCSSSPPSGSPSAAASNGSGALGFEGGACRGDADCRTYLDCCGGSYRCGTAEDEQRAKDFCACCASCAAPKLPPKAVPCGCVASRCIAQ